MARDWKTVNGKSHSFNALEAEKRGEFPLTRAIEIVYEALECKKRKVSRRRVREFLEKNCNRDWHHVAGPNVRPVFYYATTLTDDQKNELLGSPKGIGLVPLPTARTAQE